MSQPSTETPVTPPAPPVLAPPPAAPPAPAPAPSAREYPDGLGDAGKKALDAERDARAEADKARKTAETEAASIAKKLKAFEDRDKSDLEKATERATAAEALLVEKDSALLRLQVGAAKGLTPEQAQYLKGGTQTEMEAAADELLRLFPTTPAGPKTPKPDPAAGAREGQQAGNDDIADLEAQVSKAVADGNGARAIALRSKLQRARMSQGQPPQ